uniref:C-type lectin domain-containing protein n=1 Tax=Plectus sambesii TaxID=2011161 RepID=A0A914W2L3_9BILA
MLLRCSVQWRRERDEDDDSEGRGRVTGFVRRRLIDEARSTSALYWQPSSLCPFVALTTAPSPVVRVRRRALDGASLAPRPTSPTSVAVSTRLSGMADQRLRALLLLLYAFWNNVHAVSSFPHYFLYYSSYPASFQQNPSDTGQYPFDWYKGDVTMECPSSDWLQLGTKCYLPVTNTAMRWDEAAMHCRRPQNGGGQLSILDNWILTRYLAKASDAAKEPYWLGFYINEMNSSSMVTPQYGQSKSIFNSLWAKTQPTMRPGRYCVMCNLDWENETMFGWAIDACDTSKPFLCETIACFEG